jgi:hypothetical protein
MRDQVIVLVALLLCAGLRMAAGEQFRVWTLSNGVKEGARFVDEQNGMVLLQRKNGQRLTIPLASLNILDQNRIRKAKHRPRQVAVDFVADVPMPRVGYIYKRRYRDKGYRPREGDTVRMRCRLPDKRKLARDSGWIVKGTWDLGNVVPVENGKAIRTGGRFIMVLFAVKNEGKREAYGCEPALVDSKGRDYSIHDRTAQIVPEGLNAQSPRAESLGAGLSRQFAAAYEVPKKSKGLKLEVPTLETRRVGGVFLPVGYVRIRLWPVVWDSKPIVRE